MPGLAAAIASHLAPAGLALLCCPVREQVCSRAACRSCTSCRFTFVIMGTSFKQAKKGPLAAPLAHFAHSAAICDPLT